MEPPFDLDQLRALLEIAEQAGLQELILEEGDRSVALRVGQLTRPAASPMPAAPPSAVTEAAHILPAAPEGGELVPVVAPIIGLFYRAPAPGDPVFVEQGDWVEVGQTLGLIEAMKIFNEVVADVEGRVERVVAQNQQLVHSGDVLLWLNPSPPRDEGDE